MNRAVNHNRELTGHPEVPQTMRAFEMRKCTLPILPFLLAAVITGVLLPAGPAHAQSKRSTDPKDREIELLKTEIEQLEQRVDTLEGLDQRVK